MREIKFRGLSDNPDGSVSWVYGWPSLDGPHQTIYYATHPYRMCWMEGGKNCNKPIRKDTLGQFTGLYDENGSEIYNGDIVRCDVRAVDTLPGIGNQVGVVDIGPHGPSFAGYGSTFCGNVVILGNIYENPDLIAARDMGREG